MMNGRLGVESTPGQGSVFTFSAELHVAGPTEAESKTTSKALERSTVLVVDDKGFGGGGVAVEVINHFQDETPKREMDLIRQRLNRASEEYEQWQRSERKRSQ
jgi:hypothetical protein